MRERVKLGHPIKAHRVAAGRLRLERKPRDLMRPVFIITSRRRRRRSYVSTCIRERERERESAGPVYLLILDRSGFGGLLLAISTEDAESRAAEHAE